MIAKTPPVPYAPAATATPPRAPQQSVLERRLVCRVLQLYRFCSRARCRRMRGCQGDPQRCLATHSTAVPHEARMAAEAMLMAARYECVSEGSGEQWLRETSRRERAVFRSFIAMVESRDVRRRGYALKARFRRWRQRGLNRA